MRKFDVQFNGRVRGSIGAFYNMTITVKADDRESAITEMGEQFESNHIISVSQTLPAGMRGRIMPTNPDSRQQPKSLAHKMLAAHVASNNTMMKVWRFRSCTFMPSSDGSTLVFDRVTGQAMGTIMPTASAEVLAASPGIQGWSRPITSALEDDRQRLRDMML